MSDKLEMTREVGAIAFRTSPGAVGSVALWGDWIGLLVGVLTVIFLLMQMAHFVWKIRQEKKPKVQPEPWV